MGYGWGLGHGFGGGFWMILVWLVPILLLVWAARTLGGRNSSSGSAAPTKSPLDLLDEEYARGRLSRADYLQKRQDLRHD
jgi:putative membrane protein